MDSIYSMAYASLLSSKDALRDYRNEFYLPSYIYYEANGLGPMSKRAEETLMRVTMEWRTQIVNSWMTAKIPWLFYPERIAATQTAIVGAEASELIVNGTTTTNIHSLLATFYCPTGKKTKILIDELIFPSDRYAVESQIKLKGMDPKVELVVVKSRDGYIMDEEDIIAAMTDDIACVFLPSVVHSSGQLLNMKMLTEAAKARNILIGFDCSHSVGVVPHQLDQLGVDFAVWCNYKYLNGGVGCPATLYINEKYFGMEPALAGWHGYVKGKQFEKLPFFDHEKSAGGWQHGCPYILNIAPLEGAMELVNEVGIEKLREKSLALTQYFMELADQELASFGIDIVTPREPERRGGHVTFLHPAGKSITEFFDRGSSFDEDILNVIRQKKVQERKADQVLSKQMVRISFSPLFSSFCDVYQTVYNLKRLLSA